jgi:glucose-1-phosphate thymidylyltransferase
MHLIVFEDADVARLFPLTISRPAYAVTCGGYRLVDWLGKLQVPMRGIVRPHLEEVQQLDYPELTTAVEHRGHTIVMLNARVVPSVPVFRTLQALLQNPRPGVVRCGEEIAAVVLPENAPPPAGRLQVASLADYFPYLGVPGLATLDFDLPLLQYPHDVIRHNLDTVLESLEYRLTEKNYRKIADGVFAAEGAELGECVVTDTERGPILLEEDATVGPHAYLRGPAWLGARCKVNEHATVKDAVVLGHTTKIGGEIEASIVEPYTNKQHHGFIGHSYLGSWVNMGAGTCNSDLKNTYGEVKMDYGGRRVATGMQFVGCMVGDYAKTAINTGIFTGKTIGACSMVYGFVTTNVPSYVNYARSFGQVTELSPDVMVATQQRMFARRNVAQRPCDIQLLHDMYELTREERQLSEEPLSL